LYYFKKFTNIIFKLPTFCKKFPTLLFNFATQQILISGEKRKKSLKPVLGQEWEQIRQNWKNLGLLGLAK
jgi:hypothetical protein